VLHHPAPEPAPEWKAVHRLKTASHRAKPAARRTPKNAMPFEGHRPSMMKMLAILGVLALPLSAHAQFSMTRAERIEQLQTLERESIAATILYVSSALTLTGGAVMFALSPFAVLGSSITGSRDALTLPMVGGLVAGLGVITLVVAVVLDLCSKARRSRLDQDSLRGLSMTL
jgi:hypothetical protein